MAPAAVHEVRPRIPEGIRSRITSEIDIPVEVQVNEKGRVARASAESRDNDGTRRYLATQSVKAARQWRFAPARTAGGQAVAASKTLHFVFRP